MCSITVAAAADGVNSGALPSRAMLKAALLATLAVSLGSCGAHEKTYARYERRFWP
jgi:hypothetical protein